MRFGFVPFFEIELSVVVALFFLRISFPRLVRLSMGPLIGFLSRVVFGRLFGHRAISGLHELKPRARLRFRVGTKIASHSQHFSLPWELVSAVPVGRSAPLNADALGM
jgi:hypothetical protein